LLESIQTCNSQGGTKSAVFLRAQAQQRADQASGSPLNGDGRRKLLRPRRSAPRARLPQHGFGRVAGGVDRDTLPQFSRLPNVQAGVAPSWRGFACSVAARLILLGLQANDPPSQARARFGRRLSAASHGSRAERNSSWLQTGADQAAAGIRRHRILAPEDSTATALPWAGELGSAILPMQPPVQGPRRPGCGDWSGLVLLSGGRMAGPLADLPMSRLSSLPPIHAALCHCVC